MKLVDDSEILGALQIFERCRISNGHSLESIFKAINRRGTETVPLKLFTENLAMYFHLNVKIASLVSKTFDIRNRGEISAEDIKGCLRRHHHLSDIRGLLKDHPLFPNWLTSRPDFQNYFIEWTIENGAPNVALVEMALKAENRTAGDLQIILKWIKMYKILSKVNDNRLLEVSKSIEYTRVLENFNIVTQGDHGDSFYIILDGSCEVYVNNLPVGTLHTGMSFGEKALENNAPRAATVKALTPCTMMVLRSSEYKALVASARAKLDQEIVEFMHCLCPIFKNVSYARLFFMVKQMVRRVYQTGEKIIKQDDAAASFLVIMSGRADVSRRLCPTQPHNPDYTPVVAQNENVIELLRKSRERRNIEVAVCDARAGDIIGDDILRLKDTPNAKYSYSVTAVAVTEIILINKDDILGYFQSKLLHLPTLLRCTQKYHVSGESLVRKHYDSISRQVHMKTLRTHAIGTKYSHRVYLEPLLSRSLSTQTMQHHQARRNSIIAHSKYKKIAVDALKDPIERKKVTRRESMISFLVASNMTYNVSTPEKSDYPQTKAAPILLTPAQVQRRKSVMLSQPLPRKMSVNANRG